MKTNITLMRRVGNDLIRKNQRFFFVLLIIGAIFPMIIELVNKERMSINEYFELSLTYLNILLPTILAFVIIGMFFSVARHYSKKNKSIKEKGMNVESEKESVLEKRGIKELLKMMYKTMILGNISFFGVIIIVGILFSVATSIVADEKLNYSEMIGMALVFYRLMIPVMIIVLAINLIYVLLKFFTRSQKKSYLIVFAMCLIGIGYIVFSFLDKTRFYEKTSGAINAKYSIAIQNIEDCKNEGLIFYIDDGENINFRCGGELLFTYSEHKLPVSVLQEEEKLREQETNKAAKPIK